MALILSDYQLDAIKRMHNGCILYGGVGTGKSRTALAYYYKQNGGDLLRSLTEYYPMNDPCMDLYIITTAKKRDSHEWEEEMVPFLISPDPKHDIYENHKVVIDSWNNIPKYAKVSGAFFIFDEQRVIGYGKWTQAFLKIAKANQWILLSATPGDTWTDYMPVFIANGFYRNKTDFVNQHVVYKRTVKYPAVDRYLDTGRLMRLRSRVLVPMKTKHVTNAEHEMIYCDYDHALYKAVCGRVNPWKTDARGRMTPITSVSDYCYLLRKVVNSDPSRLDALIDILKKHPKVILFYNFDYELELLRALFDANDILYAEWNGHLHQDIPDGDKWVYVVQYNAGNEGWNCIKTDTVIFYSQHYSYKVMVQAAGRIDRRNTPWPKLYYYHLKSRSGIDISISDALNKKKKFNMNMFVKFNSKGRMTCDDCEN